MFDNDYHYSRLKDLMREYMMLGVCKPQIRFKDGKIVPIKEDSADEMPKM